MAKVNFTKEHFNKLNVLASKMLFENGAIQTRMGQVLNIVDLLHTTTIGTLNDLRVNLAKRIESLENIDEWTADDSTQEKLVTLKSNKELVNLIVGYKRHLLEVAAAKTEKAKLSAKLEELREAKKTPDEKIQELENKLADLETEEIQ